MNAPKLKPFPKTRFRVQQVGKAAMQYASLPDKPAYKSKAFWGNLTTAASLLALVVVQGLVSAGKLDKTILDTLQAVLLVLASLGVPVAWKGRKDAGARIRQK